MRATISASDLIEALGRVSVVAENHLPSIIQQTTKISVRDGVMSFAATNGAIDVVVQRACESEADGEFCVYPSMLLAVIQTPTVALELKARKLHVTSGGVKASLATIPAEQFVMRVPSYPAAIPVNLSALTISKMSDEDDWKSAMMLDSDYAYATNGKVFVRRAFPVHCHRIAVDSKLVQKAMSVIGAKNFPDCKFKYDNSTVQISAASISVTIAQNAEVNWPTQDMFSGNMTRRIVIEKDSLMAALNMTVNTAMGEEPIANFVVDNGETVINIHSPLLDATYQLSAKDVVNLKSFSLHAKQTQAVIAQINADELDFRFIGNYAIVNDDNIILMRGKPE